MIQGQIDGIIEEASNHGPVSFVFVVFMVGAGVFLWKYGGKILDEVSQSIVDQREKNALHAKSHAESVEAQKVMATGIEKLAQANSHIADAVDRIGESSEKARRAKRNMIRAVTELNNDKPDREKVAQHLIAADTDLDSWTVEKIGSGVRPGASSQ